MILGHLIPAGTAFGTYNQLKIAHLAEPPPILEVERPEIDDDLRAARAALLGELPVPTATSEESAK